MGERFGTLVRGKNRYRIYRLLALLWMSILFWLSSRSQLPLGSVFWGQDKLEHAIAFGILGFLYAGSLRLKKREFSLRQVLVVTLLVAAYGLLDEFHQLFVWGREASVLDFLADTTGGFVAALAFWKA